MSRDALVVGISTYQNLPGLNAPAQDAEAIASLLETYGDFRVARLPEIVQSEKLRIGLRTPVTLAELESSLVKLFKPKGSNIPTTAVFYFSGHGLQKEAGIREGYLATSDANPNTHFYGLSLFWLRRLLQESPVRQRIVLLDCCHSGEILSFLEADPGARAGTDRLFMAASREYESAYESINGVYSVFTQALLEGLDPQRLPTGVVTNYALADWVSNALKGESQQPLFENSGSEIVLTRCQNPVTVMKPTQLQEVCPYRGLEPFHEAHAQYFFGRETLTDQLLAKLRTANFLAVVGASGSGKSSLVRAGLVYKLQRGQTLSGSDRWHIRLITPTEHPLKSLANAFVNPESAAVDRAEQLRRAELFLQEGGSGLSQLVRASLMSEDGSKARMVLIIDQFEETFTLCQGPQAERDRHRFFNCLLAGLREAGDRLSVVIVLRADFFSKCSFYRGLAEQIEHNLVMVTPLSYEQIKASILKPAQKVGLVCEPNLVYNILLDIVGAPGELPLLQYTLLELWQRRQQDPSGGHPRLTLDAYTELGGVRGTLQKRADEIFYSLSPDEQQIAKRIFIALTQLGEGTEDTRRRVLKSELVSPQFSSELVEVVLEKLVLAKLIVMNQVSPGNDHQERIDQQLANVSTALRLAQVMRSKSRAFPESKTLAAMPQVQATLKRNYSISVSRFSETRGLEVHPILSGDTCQETVDIAHEALIRNWGLLRSWLDENREMLRRQRHIERTAREWQSTQEQRSGEYLLHGSRLLDAEDFLASYPNELSALAQRFVLVSKEESRRTQRELRLLQVSIPFTLLVALGITFAQYRVAVKNQAEKDFQLHVATSRQWSAIAQSVLQETDGDPNTALLISRLAAERGRTYEAEASLRVALQKLRLQATLPNHQAGVQQLAFSPDHNRLATLDSNGTIYLWSLATQKIERTLQGDTDSSKERPSQANATSETGAKKSVPNAPGPIGGTTFNPSPGLVFTPDGKLLIAIADQGTQIWVWSVESGEVRYKLGGLSGPITNLTLSPDGTWLAATNRDRTLGIWRVQTGQLQARLTQADPINSIVFSPNGAQLLVTSGKTTTLWQIATKQQKQTLPHAYRVNHAIFSPDGKTIATASDDGITWLWNSGTGKVQQTFSPAGKDGTAGSQATPATQVMFSPDGQQLAIADASRHVWVWNLESGQQWNVKQAPLRGDGRKAGTGAIAFSPDSQRIVIVGQQLHDPATNMASLYDARTGQEIGILRGHSGEINAVQFSPDGSLIATASADQSVRLWTAEVGGELPSLEITNAPIQWVGFQSLAGGPSGETPKAQPSNAASSQTGSDLSTGGGIVAVSTDGTVRRWDWVKTHPIGPSFDRSPVRGEVPGSTASPGGNPTDPLKQVGTVFLSLGDRLRNWLITSPLLFPNVPPPVAESSLEVDPGTTAFASTVKESQTLANLTTHLPAGRKLTSVAFSETGGLLAIADNLGGVELWQINPDQTLKRLHQLQDDNASAEQPANSKDSANLTRTGVIRQLAFSHAGDKLIGVGVDWTLRLWDVPTGKLQHQLSGHEAFVEQAQFSPDGQHLISASWDRTARVWDTTTGKQVTALSHQDAITSAHYSPDGQRVVTTSLDGTARVLNPMTGAIQVILAGHRGAVLDAAFSPDGRILVTASADGSARLWDASTGFERALLRAPKSNSPQETIKRVLFSPDGQYVVALSGGQLQLWAASWPGLLELGRDRSLRQLKPEECLRYLRLPPNACPTVNLNSGINAGQ